MAAPASKIPVTSLRSLYGMFDLFCSLECHLAMAEEARRDHNPATLAEFFQRSVERFSEYSNVEEPFYPDRPPRKELPDPEGIDRIGGTLSLTAFLKAAGTGRVVENPALDLSSWTVNSSRPERRATLSSRTMNPRSESGVLTGSWRMPTTSCRSSPK